jgi:hypothetical protein
MSKIRYVVAFLVVAIILAVMAWKYTFRKSETSVSDVKAALRVDSPVLLQAYENNEDSANSLYLDKVITVTGTVAEIMPDSLGYSVYLKESDAISGILCSFDKEAFDPAVIKEGSQIAVKGICSGYLLDVNLNRCAVVE